MSIDSLDPVWDPLIRTIAAMVTLASEFVVVQVHGNDGPHGGPYVQTLLEDDGYTTLEAASNSFLDVALSEDAIEHLMDMGWQCPEPDSGLPNFFCLVGPDLTPKEIAVFLVKTLTEVYGVSPRDEFEFAPLDLCGAVINGEFGPPTGMIFAQNDTDPWGV